MTEPDVDPRELAAHAARYYHRASYFAGLWLQGAHNRGQDAVWTCGHRHRQVATAQRCAERELLRRVHELTARLHAGHDPEDCEPSDCEGCGQTVPRCQMPEVPYCAECTTMALDAAQAALEVADDHLLDAHRAARRGEYQAAIAAMGDAQLRKVADDLAAWSRGDTLPSERQP